MFCLLPGVTLPSSFGCRVPALNTDPAFIEDMADMVVEALALPTLTVSEVSYVRIQIGTDVKHRGIACTGIP